VGLFSLGSAQAHLSLPPGNASHLGSSRVGELQRSGSDRLRRVAYIEDPLGTSEARTRLSWLSLCGLFSVDNTFRGKPRLEIELRHAKLIATDWYRIHRLHQASSLLGTDLEDGCNVRSSQESFLDEWLEARHWRSIPHFGVNAKWLEGRVWLTVTLVLNDTMMQSAS
jgi:hypothetical protein